MQNLITHILSGHSLQFIVHNQNINFVQWGYKVLHCVHTAFVTVFQCHALKRHRPIDKKCICFFLHLIS